MSNGIMERRIKDSSVIIALAFLVFTAGIVLGSICLMKTSAVTDEGLKNYLSAFLADAQGNTDNFGIFKNALKENAVYLLIVFISGFFRVGIVFIAAALIRKGFIMGFTAASFIHFYGIKGILVTVSMLPGILLIIPAFLTFSAISADLSVRREKKEKKIVFFYIFFAIIVMTIFCAAALTEGYLTTIFMKWLSPKMIH